ncbi:MAG: protein kinase [Anaerolineae bacterium]|nr:protein kinase [Anaerolineae bacterium]
MAKLIMIGGAPVNEGEKLVVQHLEQALPNAYTLFPNVEIYQKGSPPYEYDLIVLAPHGIYIVEIKYWRGGIQGDDHSWRVAGQHNRPNPFGTANNKARVLKSRLQSELPALAGNFWVQAVVVIADDQGILQINGSSKDWICQFPQAPELLKDDRLIRGRDLTAFRRAIEAAISKFAQGRPLGPRKIGDYEIMETLLRRDHVTEYLAKHSLIRNQRPVRLRVFSYNPYLPEEQLDKRLEIIRREAEALQRIGTHPNLINLRSFATDPNDPNLFYSVTDWSDEGTLRDIMNGSVPLTLERKLEIAHGIAAGLNSAHMADVIHRDIRPENILISKTGQPILMNFDYARIAVTGTTTVGPIELDPDVPRAYMAPELLNPAAEPTQATDIYGLGVILFEMLTGTTLYDSPEEALEENTSGGGPGELADIDIPQRLNELVRLMTKPSQSDRIQSSQEVWEELVAIQDLPSSSVQPGQVQVLESPKSQDRDPFEFEVGEIINRKYQVQKKLPSGGAGQVYQVYDELRDEIFALKIFFRGIQDLQREFNALFSIRHRNIARVHDWGALQQDSRVFLVSEFVEGEPISNFTKPERRIPVSVVVQIIVDLLDALEAIHPKVDRIEELRARQYDGEVTQEEFNELGNLQYQGWLHRDIKPANLILSPNGVKLIDFNVAREAREASITYTGTPGYMLPDIGTTKWSTDADLFAVGVVFYELITGHHPYPDRQPSPHVEPTDPRNYVPNLEEELVGIILNATSCHPNRRYRSAHKFREDLVALGGVYLYASPTYDGVDASLNLEPWEIGKPNYNPYVTRLLTLYSQARRDNSGTRGFADISKKTYVKTGLDNYLQPVVLDGQFRLVIITGNAGDGKTAFIRNLEQVATEAGSVILYPTLNSSQFTLGEFDFITNYDGSQDEGDGRANDVVLKEFFEHFSDSQILAHLDGSTVHIIAINKGRILDFFMDEDTTAVFEEMSSVISEYFETGDAEQLPAWMTVIDLNQRSVVAGDPKQEMKSIFERQLEAFLQPEFWESCEACAIRNKCFIKYNVDTLSDSASGYSVRKRIETLFEIVHLRRQLHITMRDMRSALSWMIFRDHGCEDVGELMNQKTRIEHEASLLYHNAFAIEAAPPAGSNDDRLVRLLRQIDPAEVSNPGTDREVNFKPIENMNLMGFDRRSRLVEAVLNRWELPKGWEAARSSEILHRYKLRHSFLRRLLYFERLDSEWVDMLPYAQLANFKAIANGNSEAFDIEALKTLIVKGISIAEGARNLAYASDYVGLSTERDRHVKIKTFRLFPKSDFKVRLPSVVEHSFIEYSADQIIFYHDPVDSLQRIQGASPAVLLVSLDLLEMLDQMTRGFVPSQDDLSGVFVNLTIFKNALAHLPFRQLLLTRDDRNFYQIFHTGVDTLKLEKMDA